MAVRWLLAKDLRILARSPLLVALLVLYPVLIAALVGFAVTSGPDKPRVAVLNQVSESGNQIQLGDQRVNVADEAKPLFDAIDPVYVKSRAEAERKVRDGDVLAALIIPSDITRRLESAVQGAGGSARVEVLFNAEDPAKRRFVENTIKARVQDANAALTKRFTKVAVNYLNLVGRGGELELLGQRINILGLQNSEKILRAARREVPAAQRPAVDQVIQFARLSSRYLGFSD